MDGELAMHSTEVQRSDKCALGAQRESNQGESQQESLDSRQVVSNRFQCRRCWVECRMFLRVEITAEAQGS